MADEPVLFLGAPIRLFGKLAGVRTLDSKSIGRFVIPRFSVVIGLNQARHYVAGIARLGLYQLVNFPAPLFGVRARMK